MKRLILAALVILSAAFAFPALASADAPICHDGILSDDAGQGCTNDGGYGLSGSSSNYAICHDGVLSDDAGQNCPDGLYERVYGSGGTSSAVATSAPVSSAPAPTYSSSGGGCGGITPYAGGGQCWAVPYSIVQCESGGQNVPNSSGSGANGYYQLMSGGGGSKAEQDAAAARLWAGGSGAGNWVCK